MRSDRDGERHRVQRWTRDGRQRAGRKRGRLWALTLALLAAGALAACGAVDSSSTSVTALGDGTGGPAVNTAAVTTASIPNATGGSQGQLSYDASYFGFLPQTPSDTDPRAGLLSTAAGDLGMQLSLIFGRPDTPCRYQAALAARDDGYTIQGDGQDRVNSNQVQFHEVLLTNGVQYWRLDCAELQSNVGVQVLTISSPTNQRDTQQVVYVLNSIHP